MLQTYLCMTCAQPIQKLFSLSCLFLVPPPSYFKQLFSRLACAFFSCLPRSTLLELCKDRNSKCALLEPASVALCVYVCVSDVLVNASQRSEASAPKDVCRVRTDEMQMLLASLEGNAA